MSSERARVRRPEATIGERVADLRARLHEATGLLASSRAAVAEGRAPDLAPLVPMIEAITTKLGRLPAGEGQPLRPAMVALLDEITALSERLVVERARLGERLRDQGAHRRAEAAYRGRDR